MSRPPEISEPELLLRELSHESLPTTALDTSPERRDRLVRGVKDAIGRSFEQSERRMRWRRGIIAVAAAFSAMLEGRPYRPSLSVEAACREIVHCAGTQFDPEVAEIFVDEVRRRPLHDSDEHPVAEALDEPAVHARRQRDEPLLGHGPVGATDNVTLLYSHRYLLEYAEFEAERARRHARPFAVVMIEVCDLPDINRRDGYAAGDAALFEVARALEEAIGTATATSGRYSGRRLAAIVPKSGQTTATAVGDRVLRRLDGGPVVRAAVAVWQHGDHGEAVLSRACLTLERGAAVTLGR